MSRRCWGLAVLGIASLALAPSFAYSQTPATSYNKDAVKALSSRIDEHLAKVWKKAQVTPAAKADDFVFFRRLNLDLNGRIPDLSDLVDFTDNEDADKRWLWVDRFLDERRDHSQHFANVWRNIMLGYQTNQQVQFALPQFETWLRERVQKNVGLDKTVQQLLLSQQGNANMGFNPGMNGGNPQVFFLANENKAENLAAATSRVFLGVKIECAQCHEHPFAKWKKEQFWEFAAFYSTPPQNIRQPGLQPPQPKQNFQAGREILIPGTEKVVKAKFLGGEVPNWDGGGNSRKILSDWVTSPQNPFFARAMADHVWSYLMGVSLLEPIMEPSDDSPVTHPELLDDLAKGLIDNNFDAKFLIRAIVHSDAYQRGSGGAKLADKEDYQLFVRMPIRALSPEQLFDSVVWATTNPISKLRSDLMTMPNQQQFFNPGMQQSPRQSFLLKFTNQDRRHEPQTSILQALFMMNGKFMAERTKVDINEDLALMAYSDKAEHVRDGVGIAWTAGEYLRNRQNVKSLYRWVLSREPRSHETERLVRYLGQGDAAGDRGQRISDVYWALLNSSEFLLNH